MKSLLVFLLILLAVTSVALSTQYSLAPYVDNLSYFTDADSLKAPGTTDTLYISNPIKVLGVTFKVATVDDSLSVALYGSPDGINFVNVNESGVTVIDTTGTFSIVTTIGSAFRYWYFSFVEEWGDTNGVIEPPIFQGGEQVIVGRR